MAPGADSASGRRDESRRGTHEWVRYSDDAAILLRPARAYRELGLTPPEARFRVGWRRPLLLLVAMGSLVSLAASGALSLRLAIPAILWWGFIPLIETLALLAVVWRRRAVPVASLVDLFFAGHGAWIVTLILMMGLVSFAPASSTWRILTGPCLGLGIAAAVWSFYVDRCFFRFVVGASPRRSVRDVALLRVLTWPLVIWIVAGQARGPASIAQQAGDLLAEVLRR